VETGADRIRRATAGGATIEIDRRSGMAFLKLVNQVTVSEVGQSGRVVQANSYTMEPVALPGRIVARAGNASDRDLLAPSGVEGSVAAGRDYRRKQAGVIEDRDEYKREILGVIHSRLAFSASAFVLVILGAALGIIRRGSHVLTAFGIAFLPALFVIVTIIMGRQLAQNEGMTLIGLCTIWAGIVVVGGLDVWTLTRVLKR